MKILGVILAGGKSSRMGQDKALMQWQGLPLIVHVAKVLRPQVAALAINANGNGARFSGLQLPIFPDVHKNSGTPLVGLHASLAYAAAHAFEAVLTAPCDGPYLPHDLGAKLAAQVPSIAASNNQKHPLTGLWPVTLQPMLEGALADGMRRVQDFAVLAQAQSVEWACVPRDPFVNINTPEDFLRLSENP